MFSRLSIKLRIWVTVGCLVVLLLLLGLVGQFSTGSGQTALRETYSVQLASAVAMGDSKYNLAIARVTMDRAILHPESPDLPTLIEAHVAQALQLMAHGRPQTAERFKREALDLFDAFEQARRWRAASQPTNLERAR